MSGLPTLGQAWRAARDRLAGIETATLDARLLAEAAFGLSRLELATRENEPVDINGATRLDALIARRLSGEPVARILGHKEFYGLDFTLNTATLVPRPETELLVELALAHIVEKPKSHLLDLGTGTGCIPIAVLANAPQAHATATDLSPEALAAARKNAELHGVEDRVDFLQGSWFAPLTIPPRKGERAASVQAQHGATPTAPHLPPCGGGGEGGDPPPTRFNVIVSNPPYIETAEIPGLAREVRDFDPALALDGGPDGLAPYRIIAAQAPDHLAPGGLLAVEIGSGQGAAVARLFTEAGLRSVSITKDLTGLDRVVMGYHL